MTALTSKTGLWGAILIFVICFGVSCNDKTTSDKMTQNDDFLVELINLDPGHFHAALVQKKMYAEVNPEMYVLAPNGPEVKDYLGKIEQYNTRSDSPTNWTVKPLLGDDFLDKMISEKPGNVMVVAGKNSKKIDYVLAAVKAGINVYADKPLVITPEGYDKMIEAFKIAEENGVMIYDIMTERFESTTMLQKLLSTLPTVFGELVDGTPEEPAISKESVHHFFKYVSGNPLVRPPWFFDVNEEGEGIVDVTTHLVDLVQWEAFPGEIIAKSDVEMLKARRWPTVLSADEFTKVTGLDGYPDYLNKDIKDDGLNVYCNGEMIYKIRGKHAKVSVIWNYQAPEGTGDTHYSIMRGTKANLIIKQGADEGFKPILYIESMGEESDFESNLTTVFSNEISEQFKGATFEKVGGNMWKVNVPDVFKIGHEAHFGQVTENFLKYMKAGELPAWEVPNMKTKYYTTIEALKMAKSQ